MKNKILIKNGTLFCGDLHKKASIQNILILDGKINTISSGSIPINDDTHVIDASGKWITPGFIDSHTHYDAELVVAPGLKESARHGVSTVILGSCSVSAIYNSAEVTADLFTRVEALPREVVLPILETKKTWANPKQWVQTLNKLPLGINIASFIGHSDIRAKAMGIEASVQKNQKATQYEQELMSQYLTDSLDAGFIGLSTMDSPWDKMDGDKYWSRKTPSFYGSWKERKPLIKILRKRGAVLQGAPNLVTRLNALKYMFASIGIVRRPLKTTMIALIDLIGDRYILPLVNVSTTLINRILRADFRMQSPPCPFIVYYDGFDSVMFEEFPSGEAIRHLAKDLDAQKELIHNHTFRQQFKKEFKKKYSPRVWHRDLTLAVIFDCPDKDLIGKNFMQIANEQKIHPVDAFLDIINKYQNSIRWRTILGNDREKQLKQILNSKDNIISFSDAGAHLRNMAFYDFPLKMIKRVQDSIQNNNPIMPMEKCIWRLTKEQADWFGLNCGHIAQGKVADLNIIDPVAIKNVNDKIYERPIEEFDNYPRYTNRCKDVISHVIVAGNIIFQDQKFIKGYGKKHRYGRFIRSELK